MGFIQTGFLAALGALAIPIAIHLIFRRRTRLVSLGTLHFLKVVLKENARRRKVKRWLLLSLRMACVTLLAVLFARPYLIASGLIGDKHRFAAVLIDRSASMELRHNGSRLLDRAVEEAKKIIRAGGDNLQVKIAFFDQSVHPLGEGDGRPREQQSTSHTLMNDLTAPEASFLATNYGAAMAWARDVCIQSEQPNKEIHIFTDLQRSGLDWTTAESLPQDIEVHLHDLGRSLANNVAVTSVQTSKSLVRPGETLLVRAAIFNSGPFPLEKISVTLKMDDGKQKHLHHENVQLEAGATTTIEFEIASLRRGFWQGTVEIDVEDELSFDNRRYFGVMAAPQLRVLLIDGDPRNRHLLSETYFLETALRLAEPGETYPESPYEPITIPFTRATSLPNLEQADLVVLANVAGLDPAETNRLRQFVQRGGGLLVFTGENVKPDGYRSFESAGLSAGELSETKRAEDLPFRLTKWEEEHTIFQPFNDPQYGNLRRLSFRAYTNIKPHDDAKVLATFRGGDPALLERRLGKGKILWFTSTCDREWNNWSRSRLFLPLVHQMFGYLSGLAEGGPVREILIDAVESFAGEPAPGIYERDGFHQVVNTSPRESETNRCTEEDFANRFQFRLHEMQASSHAAISPGIPLSTNLRDDEIWHWVALVLVGFLFIESFVANRTAA